MKKQTLFLTVIPAIIIDLIINYFSLGQNDDIKNMVFEVTLINIITYISILFFLILFDEIFKRKIGRSVNYKFYFTGVFVEKIINTYLIQSTAKEVNTASYFYIGIMIVSIFLIEIYRQKEAEVRNKEKITEEIEVVKYSNNNHKQLELDMKIKSFGLGQAATVLMVVAILLKGSLKYL